MDSNSAAEALPTKELFVDFLTKDLTLNRAITDLVDNGIDGARRLTPHGDLRGYCVRLKVSPESFEITDNCGGISIDIARRYAFRFGRPKDAEPTPHSVGQFGVGMKRALFKLGKHFIVDSISHDSCFVLDVNVDEWKNSDQWQFSFKSSRRTRLSTLIKLAPLYRLPIYFRLWPTPLALTTSVLGLPMIFEPHTNRALLLVSC